VVNKPAIKEPNFTAEVAEVAEEFGSRHAGEGRYPGLGPSLISLDPGSESGVTLFSGASFPCRRESVL